MRQSSLKSKGAHRFHWAPGWIYNCDNHSSTASAIIDRHHFTSRLQMHLPLGKWWLHGLLKQAEKRKLTKPNNRFKFCPLVESICFSACTRAFSLTYWQTLTFQKLSLFAAIKTAQTHKFSGPFTPFPNPANKTVFFVRPLPHVLSSETTTKDWLCHSTLKYCHSPGVCQHKVQPLAALIFFPWFSFNSKDRHELILAMTPTHLELSISSNHC